MVYYSERISSRKVSNGCLSRRFSYRSVGRGSFLGFGR